MLSASHRRFISSRSAINGIIITLIPPALHYAGSINIKLLSPLVLITITIRLSLFIIALTVAI
jgi:hypothetical protein